MQEPCHPGRGGAEQVITMRRSTREGVAMAATSDSKGYWLVASDGGIFTYGDANFDWSAGNENLAGPIVGTAATADGKGYWLVDSTGTVHPFGDATVLSGPSIPSGSTFIEGLVPTPSGDGYWLYGILGDVYSYGDALNYGLNN
jgi:hypothetical protein